MGFYVDVLLNMRMSCAPVNQRKEIQTENTLIEYSAIDLISELFISSPYIIIFHESFFVFIAMGLTTFHHADVV